MPDPDHPHTVHLELTDVESKLRRLLLDVAAYIDDQPAPTPDPADAVHVPEALAKDKIVLRWTGGWVRDKLLNVGSHDIDLAINKLTGEHFGLKLQEYLEIPGNAEKHGLLDSNDKTDRLSGHDKAKRIAPGLHKIEANPEKSKNLETATTKIMGVDLDLVNLRKETYNEVSRNPQMEFGTAEEDAMRRDATVNAMFYNLHTCQVEDFTGQGFDDMAAKTIRTPLEPYQTFKDDPLRVLRLIRFASRLDYQIEPETEKAMGNPEIQDVLKIKISRERVGIELEKMLKGPRPRMALELIQRLGLYRTVFTDPTRELPSEPETDLFHPAYELVDSILATQDGVPSTIPEHLLRNADEQYLAWICATMMPWADAPQVPHPKPLQRPYYAAYLVAREGFKAPNKISDIVAASLSHSEEIRSLVAQCAKGLQSPTTINPTNDATARDTLGMAIRRWGSTWRTQVLFNLIHEIVLGQVSKEQLLTSYAAFLTHLAKLDILDADTFKPLLNGKDLAKALNTKPGPWMKDALDIVMAWQLRNPSATDPAEAIEAVKHARQSDSELPSRLASHFLQLTIPPLFAQNKPASTYEAATQPAPWTDATNAYVLDLLEWSIGALRGKAVETNWHLLVPPVLKMIDDADVPCKARACHMLNLLLESLVHESTPPKSSSKSSSPSFLDRTGYTHVFTSSLYPLFTYLPSLTPESPSATLLAAAHAPLTTLALAQHTLPARTAALDTLLRTGVLDPLAYLPTPWTYPHLSAALVDATSPLLDHLGIESVKHVPRVLPLLTSVLSEPFALAHERLAVAALQAVRAVLRNAWPRVPAHRAAVMMGLCVLWGRCVDGAREAAATMAAVGGKGGQEEGKDGVVERVKGEVQETVAMLDAVLCAGDVGEEWAAEKAQVEVAGPGFADLFDACRGGNGKT